MTDDVAGGVSYAVPISELPEVLALLHRGAAFCSTNQVPLSAATVARIRDLEATVAAMRPVRTAEVAPPPVAPSPVPLHPPKMNDMSGLVVVSPAAACRMLGVSRQRVNRRLLDGSLEGWRDDAGHWQIPVTALEGAKA
ncbi:MAG: hypothetical protein ACLQCU_09500, partial [Acidimicrobiales bacterium]